MIIRIMGQGQFQVKSSLFDKLNKIDNRIVHFVQKGDEKAYRKGLSDLIAMIKKEGTALGTGELMESDIIVPPADMSFDEARQVFTGAGIFRG